MKSLTLALLLTVPLAAGESPAELKTMTGTLHGTLLVPDGKEKVPVVLLVAGSGPTDRDGNSGALPGKNDSLKMLAEGLAKNGIASLRYDKRAIGASRAAGVQEKDLRFETYVADAAAWAAQLGKDPRFSRVVIAGHSEGSLIGMIAAQKGDADAFVSIAGVGRPAAEIIRTQVKPQLPPELMAQVNAALDALVAQKSVETPPPGLDALFRPSVQPYLMSWFRYDPAAELAKLKIPVLIVQGATDVQVTVDDARTLGRGRAPGDVVIIERMNHVLKAVEGDLQQQIGSYSDPALPVVPRLVEVVSAFVKR